MSRWCSMPLGWALRAASLKGESVRKITLEMLRLLSGGWPAEALWSRWACFSQLGSQAACACMITFDSQTKGQANMSCAAKLHKKSLRQSAQAQGERAQYRPCLRRHASLMPFQGGADLFPCGRSAALGRVYNRGGCLEAAAHTPAGIRFAQRLRICHSKTIPNAIIYFI